MRLTSESQNAGHVAHPAGMCLKSRMNNPLLNLRRPSKRIESRGPSSVADVDIYTKGSFPAFESCPNPAFFLPVYVSLCVPKIDGSLVSHVTLAIFRSNALSLLT